MKLWMSLVLNRLHLMLLHSQIGEQKKELLLPPSIISSIFITVFVYFPEGEIKKKGAIITAAFRMNEMEPASNFWLALLRPWFLLSCCGAFQLKNECFCCMLNKCLCAFVKPACESVTLCARRKSFFSFNRLVIRF